MAHRFNWLNITTGNGGRGSISPGNSEILSLPQNHKTLHVNTFLTGIKWSDVVARDVVVPSQANTVLVGARIAIRIG